MGKVTPDSRRCIGTKQHLHLTHFEQPALQDTKDRTIAIEQPLFCLQEAKTIYCQERAPDIPTQSEMCEGG